jgi:fatty acid desaturase
MAISDVASFAHLSDADVEALGREFDAIREEIEESRGGSDAAYIARIITIQRQLMVAGRLTLFASSFPPAWVAGTALLAVGKILENMEIGHNVMHGQWDWMNDPEIHSGTWEWDNTCPADQWKHSHNFVHHTFTNVLEKDNDVGYGILRVTSDQKWHPANLGQPVYYAFLALLFEWGVALHDLDIMALRKGEKDSSDLRRQLKGIWRKVRRQVGKDYLIFPLLTGPNFPSTLSANVTANLVRNLWSNMIIFCGHFPDGAEKFTEEELDDESKAEWYLLPDLPSNRYPEIAERVRALCEKYDVPYTTGPLYRQYGQTLRTLLRLSLPTRSATPTSDSPRPRRANSDELHRYAGPAAPQAAVA